MGSMHRYENSVFKKVIFISYSTFIYVLKHHYKENKIHLKRYAIMNLNF